MKRIIVLLIVSLMMITAVSAIDSDGWQTVTIKHHDFKIPPQYSGGELDGGKYVYENWRVFQISVEDKSLPMVYGFADTEDAYVEDLDVGGHAVRYFNQYNNAEKGQVSKAFFSSGQSIYMISWKSDDFSEDVKEVIASSEPSEFSSDEFYDILKEAKSQYLAQRQADINTPDPIYYQPDHSHDRVYDFMEYYMTYRLINHYRGR